MYMKIPVSVKTPASLRQQSCFISLAFQFYFVTTLYAFYLVVVYCGLQKAENLSNELFQLPQCIVLWKTAVGKYS